MKFNPEINLGTLLELAVFMIAVVGGVMKFGRLEAKLNIMFDWFQTAVIHRNGNDDDTVRRFHGQ